MIGAEARQLSVSEVQETKVEPVQRYVLVCSMGLVQRLARSPKSIVVFLLQPFSDG